MTRPGLTPHFCILLQKFINYLIRRKLIHKRNRQALNIFFISFPELFWNIFRFTIYYKLKCPPSCVLTRQRKRHIDTIKLKWMYAQIQAKRVFASLKRNHLFFTTQIYPILQHIFDRALIKNWLNLENYSVTLNYTASHPRHLLYFLRLNYFFKKPVSDSVLRVAWRNFVNEAFNQPGL
jgi:hypothetical protein